MKSRTISNKSEILDEIGSLNLEILELFKYEIEIASLGIIVVYQNKTQTNDIWKII